MMWLSDMRCSQLRVSYIATSDFISKIKLVDCLAVVIRTIASNVGRSKYKHCKRKAPIPLEKNAARPTAVAGPGMWGG